MQKNCTAICAALALTLAACGGSSAGLGPPFGKGGTGDTDGTGGLPPPASAPALKTQVAGGD